MAFNRVGLEGRGGEGKEKKGKEWGAKNVPVFINAYYNYYNVCYDNSRWTELIAEHCSVTDINFTNVLKKTAKTATSSDNEQLRTRPHSGHRQ